MSKTEGKSLQERAKEFVNDYQLLIRQNQKLESKVLLLEDKLKQLGISTKREFIPQFSDQQNFVWDILKDVDHITKDALCDRFYLADPLAKMTAHQINVQLHHMKKRRPDLMADFDTSTHGWVHRRPSTSTEAVNTAQQRIRKRDV